MADKYIDKIKYSDRYFLLDSGATHDSNHNLSGTAGNFETTGTIKASTGIFNELIATTLSARTAKISELTAQNATVMGIMDVKGKLMTNSWEAASIANVGGNFYISPTGKDTGTPNVSITCNSVTSGAGTYTITVSKGSTSGQGNGFGVSSTSSSLWSNGSRVLMTGNVKFGTKNYPLGSLDGLITNITISSNTITSITINTVVSSALDLIFTEQSTLAANSALSGNSIGSNMQISLYQSKSGSYFYPIGILLSSYGQSDKQQYIDIYGGAIKLGRNAADTANLTTGMAEPTLRIGQLDGLPNIVDGSTASDTTPTGWGIYTTNGFFKGKIVANAGKIATWNIGSTSIYSGTNSMTSTTQGTYIGTGTDATSGIRNYKDANTFVNISQGVITAQGANIQGAIEASSFNVKNNNVTYATMNTSGITLGQTSSGKFNILITDTAVSGKGPGILLRQGTDVINEITSSGMKIYGLCIPYQESYDVSPVATVGEIAVFGTSTRIGATVSNNTIIDETGITFNSTTNNYGSINYLQATGMTYVTRDWELGSLNSGTSQTKQTSVTLNELPTADVQEINNYGIITITITNANNYTISDSIEFTNFIGNTNNSLTLTLSHLSNTYTATITSSALTNGPSGATVTITTRISYTSSTNCTASATCEFNYAAPCSPPHYSFGKNNQPYGTYGFSLGQGTKALGMYSISAGYLSEAKGQYSCSIGKNCIALGSYQTVIGSYNETDKNAIFIVGNGTSDSDRSNLMVISDKLIRIGSTNKTHLNISDSSVRFYDKNNIQSGVIYVDDVYMTLGNNNATDPNLTYNTIALKIDNGQSRISYTTQTKSSSTKANFATYTMSSSEDSLNRNWIQWALGYDTLSNGSSVGTEYTIAMQLQDNEFQLLDDYLSVKFKINALTGATTIGGHDSPIGTIVTSSASPSVSSGTTLNNLTGCYIDLTTGVWLVSYACSCDVGASGKTLAARLAQYNDNTLITGYTSSRQIIQSSSTLALSATGCIPIEVTNNTDRIYVQAYQNSGSSKTINGYLRAVRIS